MNVLDEIKSENQKPFYHDMTTIIIGTTVIDYKTMEVDITPFPEYDSSHHLTISAEGMVFSGEKNNDGSRYQSGVIESHFATTDWQLVLSTYKKWLADEGRSYSFMFVLLGGVLVHHEIDASALI